jgi:hypothetical protein
MSTLDEHRRPVAIWDLKLDRVFLSQSKKLNAAKRAEFAALTENPALVLPPAREGVTVFVDVGLLLSGGMGERNVAELGTVGCSCAT